MPSRLATPALALLFAVAAGAAAAHSGGVPGGLAAGFTHPIFGWDHVAAMVAVGLWGAVLGAPMLWALPVLFPLVMAGGAVLGILGVPLPAVETGIALSGVVLGLAVAFAVRAPVWVAAVIVGVFAIFHGHAHGAEFSGYAAPSEGGEGADPFAYFVGFVAGTGLLHLAGILLGLLVGRPGREWALRTAGAAIAAVGGAFLLGLA